MRKVLFLFLGLLVVASCKNDKKTSLEDYVFLGKVTNIPDGTQVYVTEYGDGNAVVSIDTLEITNGEFLYEFPERKQPTINSLKAERSNGLIYFINDGEPLEMTIQRDEGGFLVNDPEVKGGESNRVFMEYLGFLNDMEERAYRIPVEYSRKDLSDPKVVAAQEKEERDLFQERADFQVKTVKEHPNTLAAAYVIADLISSRALTQEETKELYDRLSDDVKGTFIGKQLNDFLTPPESLSIGETAPDFSAPTPEGKELSLQEVLAKDGKYTLVEFWASWCPDCQEELPHLVEVYREFHSKGLNIVGVSIDNDRQEWENLIEKYEMDWDQVSNLNQWDDQIVRDYGVTSIPNNFLLDENGKVVATKLKAGELKAKLDELLSK